MSTNYRFRFKDESISHHGILGQKWGVQNGPPYPLGSGEHSTREKRAGWRKSLNKKDLSSDEHKKEQSGSERKKVTKVESEKKQAASSDNFKKFLKIGAISVAAGLAAYGGYRLIKSGVPKQALGLAKDAVNSLLSSNGKTSVPNVFESNSEKSIFELAGITQSRLGKSYHELDRRMIYDINKQNRGSSGGDINCVHCTTAYILNSLFDKNVTATPFSGIDEVTGMKRTGRSLSLYNSIFSGIKEHKFYSGDNNSSTLLLSERSILSEAFKRVKNGSTGVVAISGHVMNYEKNNDGSVLLIDPQDGSISDLSRSGFRNMLAVSIMDFSDATIRDGAEEVLKYLVQ